ncbi:Unannotated [Lentimonas sp. CC4]|uniref:DUF4350 domain-containing protein n=2 Tax=Lentimonas TaxID=417293 RepID=UPI001324B66D|nr:DUF4350 domain-containing protein [Lentimonas sp. CC8]CAA6676643.1 Unannotated [Lentimonas sp. CC4]CAA6684694.1 Unannotated [Lentimonas sp. CC6]CAA7170982.1 Unannotated [Lentimonas sp. CC21]CAA7075329.1 Unannotated [Lentimonas sp. CC4]CAA7182263.1 Unannotated [Lentimonas sp. CC8]
MRMRVFILLLLVVALVGLLAGVSWLIHLRFETGQAYPRGSSLRADPVGVKALFEAYESIDRLDVRRNFTPLNEIDDLPSEATLLLLNTRGWNLYQLAQFDSIERFVSSGGRLVVALNPEHVAYQYIEGDDEGADEDSEAIEGQEEVDRKSVFARRAEGKQRRFWAEVELVYGEHEGGDALCVDVDDVAALPLSLPWREGGALGETGEDWTPVYQIEEEVVVAQRAYGRGSIVLLTDDYLFSNEALLKHRYAELLTWVLGDQSTIIFDETHLGVSEGTGVAMLMRRYRLGGFCLGCAVLLLLVVWRGVSPLLPAHAGRSQGNVMFAEHSTEAGLSDLVRRSVSAVDLPREAFSQWKDSFIRNAADEAYYAQEIQEVHTFLAEYADLPKRKRKPFECHLNIQSIINRKKRRRL